MTLMNEFLEHLCDLGLMAGFCIVLDFEALDIQYIPRFCCIKT